jgi:aminoglycoside phosphotransferase (APT) family kinase protein
MSTPQGFDKLEIILRMVSELIAEQFPQWSDFEINPVELNGIDNRTFRLGKKMSLRLPSAKESAL